MAGAFVARCSLLLCLTSCGAWGFSASPPSTIIPPRRVDSRAFLASATPGPMSMPGMMWGVPRLSRDGAGVGMTIRAASHGKRGTVMCSAAAGDLGGIKSRILDLCDGTGAGVMAPQATRDEINSLIEKLCTMNPTPKPAKSSLLNGRWRVRYSTAPPPSNGQLGPFIGSAFQSVDLASGVYDNLLLVGDEASGGWLKACLRADWQVVDDNTWTVFFRTLDLDVLGLNLIHKEWESNTRVWDMTFLDSDTRVVYGARGPSEAKVVFYMTLENQD